MTRNLAIKLFVPGGLAVCALANLWIETPAAGAPGVALGSETLLVVERTVALFGAWMLGLVILAESTAGRLSHSRSRDAGSGTRTAQQPRRPPMRQTKRLLD